MCILKFNFKLLTLFGCWRPDSWASLYKRIIYHIHTSIITFLLNSFMLTQLIDVLLTTDNASEFFDNIYILISVFNVCCKYFVLLINRKNILILINILMEKPCKPSTSTEMKILYKFDKNIQIYTKYYVYLAMISIFNIVLSSLFINFGKRKLMFRAWLPFDYTSTVPFCLTYIYQLIGIIIAACVNVGCDTLICGLLFHICCQIEILTYRLRKIISYSNIIRDCVLQHYNIFRLSLIILQILQILSFISFTLGEKIF
ncbi:odorant receptor 46a-like [Solenopsis invicta]|uniref:odorant receptor 46a-like n=1 Tax=Solenopsis invicta TaxID=13686 RepID=UPI00193CF216|nr:odorant receptor 46a-like [Solenopsis invicta]